MLRELRVALACLCLLGCDLLPAPEPPPREEADDETAEPTEPEIEAPSQIVPMVSSEWTDDNPPPDLVEVAMGNYQPAPFDEGVRIERDGEVRATLAPGELACSAWEGRLACVHSNARGLRGVLLGEWPEPIDLPVRQEFFDPRTAEGPPRWTRDGALWIQLGERWERREIGWPRATLPAEARASAVRRLRERLPEEVGADFEELTSLRAPALVSEPVDARRAFDLWRALEAQGVSRVVVPAEWLGGELPPSDVADARRRALELPVHAVWAQLEATRNAWERQVRERARDHRAVYRGAAPLRAALAEVRRTGEGPIPPAEAPAAPASFVHLAESSADAGRYRVVVVEGDGSELPILLGFGGFNHCPTSYRHAVVLRDWHARFGAQLVFLSSDTMELSVPRPPQETSEVYEVAFRHHLYVGEGQESLAALASIAASPRWFFWWD